MKEHMGFMQRTPAEKADWGSTLIIGNIHEMRQSDLDCIRIIVNDEHKRRIDGQPTPAIHPDCDHEWRIDTGGVCPKCAQPAPDGSSHD